MDINKIIITNRIRKDLGDLTALKKSMESYGLLHPIIINSNNHLISGERRLQAAKELNWTEIDVVVKNISYQDAISIELSENISRKEFTNSELLKGLQKQQQIHSNIFHRFIAFCTKIWNKIVSHSNKSNKG